MTAPNTLRKPTIIFVIVFIALGLTLALLITLPSVHTVQAAPAIGGTSVSGPIITHTTWTLAGSPYILTDNVTVTAGITLTIEPGVTVMGYTNTKLQVEGLFQQQGNLRAIGTPASPITFTFNTTQWTGVVFSGGSGYLEHVTIKNLSALYIHHLGILDSKVTIRNSTIQDSSIFIYGMVTPSQTIIENLIVDNVYSFSVDWNTISYWDVSNITFQNNVNNRILISNYGANDYLVTNTTLIPFTGLEAYVVDEIIVPVGITLTIEPGVSIVVDSYLASIEVEGYLSARGTMTNPITITAENIKSEVFLVQGGAYFDWVIVRDFSVGICIIDDDIDSTEPVIIKNSFFEDNEYSICFFDKHPNHRSVYVENTIFKDSNLAVGIGALPDLHLLNVEFQDDDNYDQNIEIYTGYSRPLTDDVTLISYPGLDGYRIFGWDDDMNEIVDLVVPEGVVLKLEAGVKFVLEDDMAVEVNGAFCTNGTNTRPITITANAYPSPASGDWKGLVFNEGVGNLQYTTVEYGERNITLNGPNANLHMTNSHVMSGSIGLMVENGRVRADCSAIAHNQTDGIHVASGSTPIVNVFSSSFYNNGLAAINNENLTPVNAQYNWWGDMTGPGGIGPGNGDVISGAVAYDPWLTQPNCPSLPIIQKPVAIIYLPFVTTPSSGKAVCSP